VRPDIEEQAERTAEVEEEEEDRECLLLGLSAIEENRSEIKGAGVYQKLRIYDDIGNGFIVHYKV